jgi:hypothetical protein
MIAPLQRIATLYNQEQHPDPNKLPPYDGAASVAELVTGVAPVPSGPTEPLYDSALQAVRAASTYDGARALKPSKEEGPQLPWHKHMARVLRTALTNEERTSSRPTVADVAGRVALAAAQVSYMGAKLIGGRLRRGTSVAATTTPRHDWNAFNAKTKPLPMVDRQPAQPPSEPAGRHTAHASVIPQQPKRHHDDLPEAAPYVPLHAAPEQHTQAPGHDLVGSDH